MGTEIFRGIVDFLIFSTSPFSSFLEVEAIYGQSEES